MDNQFFKRLDYRSIHWKDKSMLEGYGRSNSLIISDVEIGIDTFVKEWII